MSESAEHNQGTFCTNCGHQNGADSNYCAQCGTYLAADQHTATIAMPLPGVGRDPESHVPIEPSTGHGAALVIKAGGGRSGERFRILDKTTIGRSPSSDVFLDDVTVSREHAVVYCDGNSVRVEDRASLNGTFVNHERVERSVLGHGDELQIGKYKLIYTED